jgi:GNAT superfamily N-acetyltransferase
MATDFRRRQISNGEMIRPFQPSDAKACHAIFSDCIRIDPRIDPDTRRRLILLDSPVSFIIRSREYYTVVYEERGEIRATGGVDKNEIRTVFVSPPHQGNGIGRELMRHLESRVDPERFDILFLHASESAEGFYHRMGYRSVRNRIVSVDGFPLRTIYMEKGL